MRNHGVRQWQIAEYIGISEGVLSRKMRHDLAPDLRDKVEEAIEALGSSPGSAKANTTGSPAVINKQEEA
jgi:DNA-binding LacI/PurR family transcriptional regulator